MKFAPRVLQFPSIPTHFHPLPPHSFHPIHPFFTFPPSSTFLFHGFSNDSSSWSFSWSFYVGLRILHLLRMGWWLFKHGFIMRGVFLSSLYVFRISSLCIWTSLVDVWIYVLDWDSIYVCMMFDLANLD